MTAKEARTVQLSAIKDKYNEECSYIENMIKEHTLNGKSCCVYDLETRLYNYFGTDSICYLITGNLRNFLKTNGYFIEMVRSNNGIGRGMAISWDKEITNFSLMNTNYCLIK